MKQSSGGILLSFAILCFTIGTMLLVRCTMPSDPGGSEITNGVVVTAAGGPGEGVTVSAFPIEYVNSRSHSSTVLTAITDSDGKFTVAIDSGTYNLFIVDSVTKTGSVISGVGPKMGVGTVVLKPLGTIEGTVQLSENIAPLTVFSKGTPWGTKLYTTNSSFKFEYVPSGEYVLSFAITPIMACGPGIDCTPSAGGAAADDKHISVTGGSVTSLDIIINANGLEDLP